MYVHIYIYIYIYIYCSWFKTYIKMHQLIRITLPPCFRQPPSRPPPLLTYSHGCTDGLPKTRHDRAASAVASSECSRRNSPRSCSVRDCKLTSHPCARDRTDSPRLAAPRHGQLPRQGPLAGSIQEKQDSHAGYQTYHIIS